ncbi:hypothetical protein ACTFIR_012159 [Dictyostelium discoideum]
MYKDRDTPRTDFPNYFDCTLIIGEYRYCVFHSDLPFSRLWGTLYSTVCARDVSSPRVDCTSYKIFVVTYVAPVNVKFSGLPPTSGGDIVINGTFLRFLGGPNTILNDIDFYKPFDVKGNFSDPSFDCNSITVTFPPGCGKFILFFDDSPAGDILYSYDYPIIYNIIHDSSKQIIAINGDNFFTNNSLVQVYFDNINQQSINITTDHKQIQVNNFNRDAAGPMSIAVVVKDVYVEKNYTHCFPAIITSISSVSNNLGGIVTIKGSKLSSTLNSSLIPTITIGNKQCKFIKSTTTELECKLDPNESGGKKLSVDVNFNGCNSTSSGSGPVIFTYNIPTLSSGSYSNGIDTLIGENLGNNNESFIQLYANEINIKIEKFNISSDEKILTFKLPHLKCNSFNITFTRNDISLSPLSISASLSINVINKPSVSNGTLYIELYYIECPISSLSTPTITVGNSLTNQCSIPSLPSSTSDCFQTTCSIPHGTDMNRQFTFKYNLEVVINKFSYAQPIVNDIINKDNKTLSCGSIITVSGNNLLTNDEEFKVKVLANNEDTIIIKQDEYILIVKYESNESPLNVSVFIGNDLIISNVILTYLEPILPSSVRLALVSSRREIISMEVLNRLLPFKVKIPSQSNNISIDVPISYVVLKKFQIPLPLSYQNFKIPHPWGILILKRSNVEL